MEPKLDYMGLFIDKFKEINYVKFEGNTFVENQLDNTNVDNAQYSKFTDVLVEPEDRMRRSTNLTVPGVIVAYNQRWTTAYYLSEEVCLVHDMEPVHISELEASDYSGLYTYYEDPENIDDLPYGTESVEVRVQVGVVMPGVVPDKRKFVYDLIYEQSKYEFALEDLQYEGDNTYMLNTPTIFERIKIFTFGIDQNTLVIPPTNYGKL